MSESYKSYTPSSVHILNANETAEVIASNHTFWDSLTPADWQKRNVRNISEYLDTIRPVCVTLTPRDQDRVRKWCTVVDQALRNLHTTYIDGTHIASMPWKIGFVKGRKYEFGYPHTIGDTILMNAAVLTIPTLDENILGTFAHEKMHVFQRMYPSAIQPYLRLHGFERLKRREPSDTDARPNPDLDEWIYTKNGQRYVMGSADAHGESDPDPQFFEHPFERMAIEVARRAFPKSI